MTNSLEERKMGNENKGKKYPKTRKPKVEVQNPRYEGVTPEMVGKSLLRQSKVEGE